MIRPLFRLVARWHHRSWLASIDDYIRVAEGRLANLPEHIRELRELRRFHAGRVATLSERRNPVNYHLARTR